MTIVKRKIALSLVRDYSQVWGYCRKLTLQIVSRTIVKMQGCQKIDVTVPAALRKV